MLTSLLRDILILPTILFPLLKFVPSHPSLLVMIAVNYRKSVIFLKLKPFIHTDSTSDFPLFDPSIISVLSRLLLDGHPSSYCLGPTGLNSVVKGNALTAYATRWFLTFSLQCLCSSTSYLFTSRLRLVCWLILKLENDLPIFESYYASYYAFVIDYLTWLAYFHSRDYLSVSWLSLSLVFLFISCFSMTKGQRSKH